MEIKKIKDGWKEMYCFCAYCGNNMQLFYDKTKRIMKVHNGFIENEHINPEQDEFYCGKCNAKHKVMEW